MVSLSFFVFPLQSLAAAGSIAPTIVRQVEKKLASVCVGSENPSYTEGRSTSMPVLGPGSIVAAKLKFAYRISTVGETKTMVVEGPKHGRIDLLGMETEPDVGVSYEAFRYTPEKNYLGDDRVFFEVTVTGQKFRVGYLVKVVYTGIDDACWKPGEDRGDVTPDVQLVLDTSNR